MLRLFIFFLCTLIGSAGAEEVRITLGSAADYAISHNLALRAARVRVAEARGRLRQSGRLKNPELDVEYLHALRSPENRVGISITQRFPVTARLRIERSLSRAELAAAEAEVRDAERKLAGEARTVVVKLLALRGQRELRERQIRNSRELGEFTRKRVQSAEASIVEATQVELETAQLNTGLIQLDSDVLFLVGELRPMIGAEPGDKIAIIGELPPVAKSPAPGVKGGERPDFVAALHRLEAASREAALARAQRFDEIGIGLRFERGYIEDAPQGFERELMAGVRVSIPLPLWDRNQGGIEEAVAARIRIGSEMDALALAIRTEAGAARDQMQILVAVLTSLSAVLLPNAVKIEEQLQNAYRTGQSPLTEVLRARDQRLLLERQRLDALRDYHLARTRYLTATGQITGAQNNIPGK